MDDICRVAGEHGRYYVPSSNGPGVPPYLVDICANKGNGWCGCRNFDVVHGPAWQRGEPGWHRCKHIVAAREFELDDAVRLWNLAHPQKED